MDFKKLVSKCNGCGKVTYMAVYDTVEEILSAENDRARLQAEHRDVEVIVHKATDPQPDWCECRCTY